MDTVPQSTPQPGTQPPSNLPPVAPPSPQGGSSSSPAKPRMMMLVGIVVVLVVAGVLYWYYTNKVNVSPPNVSVSQHAAPQPPVAAPQVADLGSTIYEQSQNPIQDKLPATVSPVPNPIENIYKNPF